MKFDFFNSLIQNYTLIFDYTKESLQDLCLYEFIENISKKTAKVN